MAIRILAVCCSLCLLTASSNIAAQSFELNDDNFDAWCERIQPSASEMKWADLPWLTTYSEGLQEAAREGKPLLLWTMNGHPHGCT